MRPFRPDLVRSTDTRGWCGCSECDMQAVGLPGQPCAGVDCGGTLQPIVDGFVENGKMPTYLATRPVVAGEFVTTDDVALDKSFRVKSHAHRDDIVPGSTLTVGELQDGFDKLAKTYSRQQDQAIDCHLREIAAVKATYKARLEEERSENAFLMRELKRHDPRLVAARSKNKTA